jgi:hypothetical protein
MRKSSAVSEISQTVNGLRTPQSLPITEDRDPPPHGQPSRGVPRRRPPLPR